ncbi:MAG: hypothetical protein HYZ47_04275 [Simkania negevensis]|nr:hypothetical protein [Simkania negevensis]
MIRIDGSFLVDEAHLSAIDLSLTSKELFTSKELDQFAKELDLLLQRAKEKQSKEKIISLFGRIESLRVNGKIDKISDEAQEIFQKKDSYSAQEISTLAKKIRGKIKNICFNHGLSLENRSFLQVAFRHLALAEGKKMKTAPKRLSHNSFFDFEESERFKVAIELCEIASHLYQGAIEVGMRKYQQLALFQQSSLASLLPSFEVSADFSLYQSNIMSFIRSLVGLANEIASGKRLDFAPSDEEIHRMFEEEKAALL